MRAFAKRVTVWFLKNGIVEPERANWCSYVIESRIFGFLSLGSIILLGAAFFPLVDVLILNFGVLYFRKKTSGFHLRSALQCYFFSSILELICLSVISYFKGIFALAAMAISSIIIIKLAPFNNAYMHFSRKEIEILRHQIWQRLVIYIMLILLLLGLNSRYAASLIIAMTCVALLLTLAKLGFGCQ